MERGQRSYVIEPKIQWDLFKKWKLSKVHMCNNFMYLRDKIVIASSVNEVLYLSGISSYLVRILSKEVKSVVANNIN